MRRALSLAAILLLCACAANPSAVKRGDFPDIVIEGNQSIDRLELLGAALDHLLDYEEHNVGKAAIDDAAYRIELRYRELGYAFAVVDYEIGEGQKPIVRFIVDEGPRVVLSDLLVVGGEELGPFQLQALAVSITGPPGATPYVERALEQAAQALESKARSQGYASASVEIDAEPPDPSTGKGSARLVVTLGTRLILASVEVVGEGVPEEIAREARRLLGEPYGPRVAAAVMTRIEERLRDAGYPDAKAESKEERVDEGQVTLVVQVETGELVHLSGVRFDGDLSTNKGYLEGLIELEAGQRYSATKVRDAFQKLYSTGLFEVVRHRLEPATGEERVLVWELVEIPSLELFVEPGFGSYAGPRVRAGVRERNLFGRNWILRSEGTLSDKTKRAEVGLTDPLFLGTDLVYDIAVQYNRREEPSFSFEEGVLETSLRKRWNEVVSTSLGYRFKRSNLLTDDLDLDPSEVPSDFDVSAIKLSGVNDTRDNLLNPRAGARTELSCEWADEAIGSELDFLRGTGSFGLFKELGSRTVLAGRVGAGAILPLHGTGDLPLQERFFLGGESTVRSFEESELGPKDAAGEPLGGEAYTLFSVEVRQELTTHFGLVLFGDTGSLVTNYSDVFSDPDYGSAIGLGLRYGLPVGSLRLDFGWNPNPEEDEDDYALHFSIGQAF